MNTAVRTKNHGRYETEVTYEINGAVEDMAFIVIDKVSDDCWTVATGYNNSTHYGLNNRDADMEFKTGVEAKREMVKRTQAWVARFNKFKE